jgi:PAS domain S-box-containing protein
VALTVVLAIFLIETAILIPTVRNYEQDLLARLEHVGRTTVYTAHDIFRKLGSHHGMHEELRLVLESVTANTNLVGGTIIRPDGAFISHFGERPDLTPAEATTGTSVLSTANGDRYEVVWPAEGSRFPYIVIGRLDSTWIKDEVAAFIWRILGLIVVISAFVAGATLLIFNRWVIFPLLAMHESVSAAAADSKNPERYVMDADGPAELGDLQRAVNELLERLSEERRIAVSRVLSMVDNSIDAIVAFDQDGALIYANRACATLFGDDPVSLIGRGFPTVHDSNGRGGQALAGALLAAPFSREYTLAFPDDRTIPCFISANQIGGDDRGTMFAIVRDISEQQAVQDRLERQNVQLATANRSKSEFLTNTSHELRTPLNAIIGFADIIKSEMLGPLGHEQYKEYADDISTSGQHLLNLINDLLDMAKIEAGKLDIKQEEVDLGVSANECMRMVREKAASGGLTLNLEISNPAPVITGDRLKVKQILLNLMSNAIKFTDRGGAVTVSVQEDVDEVMVRVADTGVGIAADDFDRVLAPFGQVDASLSRHNEGTGIGLPLTKALMELHHGTLELDSAVGAGTTVTLRFPRRAETGTGADTLSRGSPAGEGMLVDSPQA